MRVDVDRKDADPRRWWALSALCLAVLIAAIDVTVLNVALPTLAENLQPTGTETLWIADSYSLVLAGLLVTMGSLGDRWGRKRLLMVGSALFALLSIGAAFAPNAQALILGRGAMGVAGAMLMPSTLALIRNTFTDPKERTFAIGIWSAMAAAGEAVGPLVAGVLLEHFWWGSVFLANVPVCLAVIVIGAFALRESKNPKPGPLDLFSVLLSMVGLLSVVASIKFIAADGLDATHAWVVLAVGVACLVWFTRRQLTLAHPLIDMRLFRRRSFSGAVVADLLSIFGLAGTLFFLSLDFQFVGGLSPLQTGIHLLPAMLGAVIASPTTGRMIVLIGRRRVITGGLVLASMGLALLSVGTERGGLTQIVSLALIGVGAGWAFTATAEAIMLSAPPERAGAASAVSETAYELGSALGIAILGTVLSMIYRTSLHLPAGLTPEQQEISADSIGGAIEIAKTLPADVAEPLTAVARDSFGHGVFIASLAAAAVLLLGAILARLTLPARDPQPVESQPAGDE